MKAAAYNNHGQKYNQSEYAAMQCLPVQACGDYITRDGSRVTVDEIDQRGEYSFPVKGRIWRMYRGKYRPREFKIWTRSGSFFAVGLSPLDIVGTYKEDAE